MNTWLSKVIFIFAAAFILSETSIANPSSPGDRQQSYKFTVMLDDTPIGYHYVNIEKDANRKAVHTVANFDVRLFFIPVYSYDHETRESWEDGCLVNISSTTDDNGDDYFISSRQQEKELALETQDGSKSLDGCVRTFAYWDIELLNSGRLLNTQTGEYQSVSVTDLGDAILTIDEDELEARQFRLAVEDMTIDIWYTRDMQWLALESVTESGAVLRYLPEKQADFELETRS